MVKSKEEALGGANLPKASVTFNKAGVTRQTVFADVMGLEATKSSVLLSLLKLVSHMGWDLQVSPAHQPLKKIPAE